MVFLAKIEQKSNWFFLPSRHNLKMETKHKAVVIGSGIAGIASAIRLAKKGFDVEVFEANSYPGGKLSLLQLGNYRFDAGPSLFTMPQYVDELFQLCGEEPREHFNYYTAKTSCHYFYEDGTFLPLSTDRRIMLQTIQDTLGVDKKIVEKHLRHSAFIYKKTGPVFLERSLHKVSSYMKSDIISAVLSIPALGIFTTMHKANARALKHPKLVQLFNRYATYNGSDPYQAPGILNIIPHLEHGIGTYFPKKGMHDITLQLVALAERNGVKFNLNSRVESILENGKTVNGIVVNGEMIPADIVVCNSDVKPAYSKLLQYTTAPKKTMEQEPSSSAMIFYWGIKRSFPQLDLHNILFSEDYQTEFEHIFKKGSVYHDPTVYIHISSKLVKEDAPEGSENWFVMVNVPSNSGQNWEEMRKEIRASIIQKINRILKTNIEELIEEEDYLDPIRIETRTSSFAGALYGASSNDRMAAFFRHPNFSSVDGLYFVGGSVHPGGGIPLCLLSAKIATSMIPSTG
jgi:diapolycopene oxygenase